MFECSKTALSAALAAILPATRDRSIDILQNVLLEREGDTLILRGNCIDFELIASIPAKFSPDFSPFTCQADLFLRFVNAAPEPEIRVKATHGEAGLNAVSLHSGHTRLRIFILDATHFPRLDRGPLSDGFTLTGHVFSRPLQAVAYAVSTAKDRPFLHGVRLEGSAEGLSLIALDGMRLEYRRIPASAFDDEVDLVNLPRVTIPTASVKQILSMIEKEEDVRLEISRELMRVLVGNVIFVTKLVEEEFPDYHRAIPIGNDIRVTFRRQSVDDAIERVMLATKDATKGVAFRFEPGMLALNTYDHEIGDAEDRVEIEASRPITIGFNGRFMRDILSHMDGETVEMMLLERSKPVVLRSLGDAVNFSVLYAMNIPAMPS